MGFPSGSAGKEPACNVGNWVRSLGQEDALEKVMGGNGNPLQYSCLESSMDR